MAWHSMEAKIRKARTICTLYATDKFTIAECAQNQGIDEKTFHNWKNAIPQIAELYKKAHEEKKQVRYGSIKTRALTAMEELLTKQTITEKQTVIKLGVNGEAIPDRVVSTDRVVLPNATAMIFALKNTDSENWKDVTDQNIRVSGQLDTFGLRKLSDAELLLREQQLEEELYGKRTNTDERRTEKNKRGKGKKTNTRKV
jgi:hypothetical protein